jgi:hypothetical protein
VHASELVQPEDDAAVLRQDCGPGERATGGGYGASISFDVLFSRPTTFIAEPDAGEPAGWEIGAVRVEDTSVPVTISLWVICASEAEPQHAG